MTYSHNPGLSTYRMVAAQVSPLVAVVKLYDEAIRQLRMAVIAIENKQHEESYIRITRCCTILRGLCHNLRFDKDEDMAQQLLRAYTHNILAIHTSYGKRDAPARYARIVKHLGELRDAWASVANLPLKNPEATRQPLVGTATRRRA